MNQRVKNVAVGLTVIVALALLGGMILIFAGVPGLLTGGYQVRITLPEAGGVVEGDRVYLSGIPVGKIKDIGFLGGDATRGIVVVATIEHDVNLPANITAEVRQQFVGGASIALVPLEPPARDEQGKLVLLPRRGAVIAGKVQSGDIIAQLRPAVDAIQTLAANLNAMLTDTQAQTAPSTGPTTIATQPSVREILTRINTAVEAAGAMMDADNQANFKAALANLAKASASANEAMTAAREFIKKADKQVEGTSARVDELVDKFITGSERLSEVLASLNRAVTKIESGEGTAGRFLNDPRLYNTLVDSVTNLDQLVKDLQKLVEEWRASGVKVKM
jgi:phospholipid/cholesterol/gamma-HCH transport system substrate-binding protein